jgi:hypothetical protein
MAARQLPRSKAPWPSASDQNEGSRAPHADPRPAVAPPQRDQGAAHRSSAPDEQASSGTSRAACGARPRPRALPRRGAGQSGVDGHPASAPRRSRWHGPLGHSEKQGANGPSPPEQRRCHATRLLAAKTNTHAAMAPSAALMRGTHEASPHKRTRCTRASRPSQPSRR